MSRLDPIMNPVTSQPWILGISCSHNGSACLLHGDEVVAAVQDERLLRAKRHETSARFATHSINYCLDAGGITADDLALVVYSVTQGDAGEPQEDLFLNDLLRCGHRRIPVRHVPHHLAHAASAFALSGFDDATVLVIDGSGTRFERLPEAERAVVVHPAPGPFDFEWLSHYDASGTTLTPVSKQVTRITGWGTEVPEQFGSLGNMYAFVGVRLFGDLLDGAGKVMGLSAYGTPTIPADRWFSIDEASGLLRFTPDRVRPHAARCAWPGEFRACADLAASVQAATEEALVRIVARLRQQSARANLCYAGGVALNSVANERIVREGGFERVFIVPAAEDSGVAVGAAYHGLWQLTGRHAPRPLRRDAMGRTYPASDIDRAVAVTPGLTERPTSRVGLDAARLLCDGEMLGWFTGASELGPRALGQRSILCDPRRPDGKTLLNARVKQRDGFRPFAPVVLREHAAEWFEVTDDHAESPFMLRVWRFREGKEALVPAVAHVDGTARVQTLTREANPRLHDVVEAFHALTGVPMLLNTSFNLAGEPIVETPEDALWCLLCSGLDGCAFDDRLVHKAPGAGTMLDWRPRVAATSISVDLPVVDGVLPEGRDGAALQALPSMAALKRFHPTEWRRTQAAVQRAGNLTRPIAYATVGTRWGSAVVLLDGDQLDLLARIDGATDARRLLDPGRGWTEAWLTRTLAALCRASLITFGERSPAAVR